MNLNALHNKLLVTAIFIYAVHIPHVSPHASIRSALRTLDLLGMGFLVTWLTLLIVALNLGGGAYPWSSPVIIGLFAGFGLTLIAFILAEKYAANPVVPLGLYVKWASRNVPIMTVTRTLLFFHLYASVSRFLRFPFDPYLLCPFLRPFMFPVSSCVHWLDS